MIGDDDGVHLEMGGLALYKMLLFLFLLYVVISLTQILLAHNNRYQAPVQNSMSLYVHTYPCMYM